MSKKATKKTVAKKAATKPVAKKAATKKTVAKKAAVKAPTQAPAKKVAAKAPAKKVAAKAPAKKVAAKAPAKKVAGKSSATTIVAKANIGWGNTLYLRGEGGGLSWDKGTAMTVKGDDEWSAKLKGAAELKFLINDDIWSTGDNVKAPAGKATIATPIF